MAGRSSLAELELTGEEVARLRAAFQDEHFRRLFAEYAAELADPAQRATYEAEVVALERQRGVEARFLHPTPGWVLRTSQAGTRRCYLNVCSNAQVGRPEARAAPGGSRWALPHCLSPPREEEPGRRLVYDVLFHPDALRLAARSARFRRLLDETALDAVERQFAPGLDRANAAPLRRTKYKGAPRASLLRSPLPGGGGGPEGEGEAPLPPFPTPYAYPPPAAPRPPPPPQPEPAAAAPPAPRWTLRHRSYVDLQDYRCSRDSAPGPVPRELEVTVELPLLSAAAQARLEVRGQELRLDSERPAAYRLRLRLPYAVDEEGGRAAFDRSRRRLVVTLPVRPRPPPRDPGPLEATRGGSSHVEEEEEEPPPPPPGRPEEGGPAPCEAHVGAAPELPVCPETPRVPASACEREGSPGPSAPETPPGARDKTPLEPGPAAPLAPDARAGDPPELPAAGCSITGPSPVTRRDFLGAAMGPKKWPEVSDASPSSDLGGATNTSTYLCGINSARPVTTECQRLSCQGEHTEIRTTTVVSGHPSCSSNPATPACLDAAPSVDLSVTAVGVTNSPPPSPLLPGTGLGIDPEAPISSPSSSDSPVPASSPVPPLCPPFQCTQDEEALMLLLQVPGIVSQSLKGEVGTNHYRISFSSKDLVSYLLLLQLPPENKLTSPETSISVSFSNAVIHLTKAPETTGLWTKLYFGQNEDALQEKCFVTEDTVDEFLGSLQRTSGCSQPEMDHRPLIEVLNVSEGKSQIQLKAQERNSPQHGKAGETINPRTEDRKQLSAEKDPLATDPTGEYATHTKKTSGSLSAAETIECAGRGSPHCLELHPADSSLAVPGKLQIMKLQESELAFPADPRTTSRKQAQLNGTELGRTREDVGSDPGEKNDRPAAPVLRETDMRDGSVQFISHHTTQCAVTFQNPLLYELD